MKKLLFLLLTLSFSAFADTDSVQFICYENNINQNCTTRKPIDVSGFDSLVTDFNSNWYDTYTISEDSFFGVFWDDTVYSYTQDYDSTTEVLTISGINQFETFYIANLTEEEEESVSTTDDISSYKYKTAFYQNIDTIESYTLTDSDSNYSTSGTMIYKIYQLEDETLSMTVASDKVSIESDNPISAIQFGTNDNPCGITQTGSLSNDEYTYSLSFDTCPAIIYAADADTDEIYQYTADFSDYSFEFSLTSDSQLQSLGTAQKELYDTEGNWIGYVNYNFFTEEFSVVDQSGNAFVAVD
ncbi:MAG: hypothetical protein VXX85_04995 [Candidatus Margulisiibacteriota bacterium]|nr:hypothetical protein [Candidatus Margulisiibacteriota bacterium]